MATGSIPVGRAEWSYRRTDPAEWIAVARVPAIVDQAQFDRVQERLADKRRMASRNNGVQPYLLRGLVSCGPCRGARGGHWLPQELQARRANLRRGRAGLIQQLDRLTEAYLSGVIPLGEYERRRREIEARLVGLDRQEQQLAGDAEQHNATAKLAGHVETFCRRVQEGLAVANFQDKRALLELLVDRVIVTDSAVEIRYALPTGPDGEREPFCRLRSDYRGRHFALKTGDRRRAALAHGRASGERGSTCGERAEPHARAGTPGVRPRRVISDTGGAQ